MIKSVTKLMDELIEAGNCPPIALCRNKGFRLHNKPLDKPEHPKKTDT